MKYLKSLSNRKKLIILTAVVSLILSAFVVFGMLFVSILNETLLLESYAHSLPNLLDDRTEELSQQIESHLEDYLVRGSLAYSLYMEYDELEETERLDAVGDVVSAVEVLVASEDGQVLETTGSVFSECFTPEIISAAAQSENALFDPNTSGMLSEEYVYHFLAEKGIDEDEFTGFPMLYHSAIDDSHLLFVALDYSPLGSTYQEIGTWNSVLERLLSGLDGSAFVCNTTDGSLTGYPVDPHEEGDQSKLTSDVRRVFNRKSSMTTLGMHDDIGILYGMESIQDEYCLVMLIPLPKYEVDVLMTLPLDSFINSTLVCGAALIVFIVCTFVMFILFTWKSIQRSPLKETDYKARTKEARKRTLSGLLVVLLTTTCFSIMLFMIEGMSTTAYTSMAQRDAIQFENDFKVKQKQAVLDTNSERYLTRANALAHLLSEDPGLRTRNDLKQFCDIVDVDFLMLFDKDGNEVLASNSYTGFSVSNNSDDPTYALQPMLFGYDHVETEPAKDAITGSYMHYVASLITDADGYPDGFLLMAVNDDEVMDTVENVSLESTVDRFATQEGEVVAVVDEKTDTFAAHTDSSKIGESALDYLDESVLGRDFEGYTWYNGAYVYVSGVSSNGKDTLVIAKNYGAITALVESALILALFTLAFCLFIFPATASLCTRESQEQADKPHEHDPHEHKSRPLTTFVYGYVAYFAILALVAFVCSTTGSWMTFGFVFSGRWTQGVHLFSLWAALFTLSATIGGVWIVRSILARIEDQATSQARTYVRLADSMITYAAVIVLCCYILSMFGVDTTTMLASAGIASIAIGMGAKDLITDILAGLFIIFEGTIHVGDIVEIGNWRGSVTDMGVRTTEITNDHNDVMIITNSRICEVVNMSRTKTLCTEDFEVPRNVDMDLIPEIVDGYIRSIVEEIPELRSSLTFEGVVKVSEQSYTIRLTYSCNEADRESITLRLRTAMQLLIEQA